MFVSDLLLNLTKINICSNQSNILSFKNSIFHFFTISKYRDTYPVSIFLFIRYVFVPETFLGKGNIELKKISLACYGVIFRLNFEKIQNFQFQGLIDIFVRENHKNDN